MNIEHFLINFNMGCIETILTTLLKKLLKRLTLTWDVLKRKARATAARGCYRLTLTWDVLKLAVDNTVFGKFSD